MTPLEKEALRYLGHRNTEDGRTLEIIRRLAAELNGRVTPKSAYGIWDCHVEPGLVALAGVSIYSGSLAKRLEGCRQAALAAATLGTEADALIRRYSVRDMEKAVIAEAVCAAMIEEYCDLLESKIVLAAGGGALRSVRRFSPGYGDFDLAHQKDILRLLNGGIAIGLTLTDGYMLAPAKSVTAVIGLSEEKNRVSARCEDCDRENCSYREIE